LRRAAPPGAYLRVYATDEIALTPDAYDARLDVDLDLAGTGETAYP
jgi:hypothetical protein